MKIRPLGAEFDADGQTGGRDEANSRSSQFCESAYRRHVIHATFCLWSVWCVLFALSDVVAGLPMC